MEAAQLSKPVVSPRSEPILVIGTDSAGRHRGDFGQLALRFRGAQLRKWHGLCGDTYLISYRNSRQNLLSREVVQGYINDFLSFAAAMPDSTFMVTRFACDAGEHGDEAIAHFFAQVPDNVQIPGIWSALLQPSRAARIYLADYANLLDEPDNEDVLAEFLAKDGHSWAGRPIELVSAGAGPATVAVSVLARRLGLRHRVIGVNRDVYADSTAMATELKALWYCTHVINVVRPDDTAQTGTIRMVSLASRLGLKMEQLTPPPPR